MHAYGQRSVKKLGMYLQCLPPGDDVYSKYREWRQQYMVTQSQPHAVSDLCKLAHNQ